MTITTFVMPQLLVMKVPIIGPLAMLPMAASAAFLVDLLVSKGEAGARIAPTQGLSSGSGKQQGALSHQQGLAPTLPREAPPPVTHGHEQADLQGQGLRSRPTGSSGYQNERYFEGASAPPWPT